jgi:hypothetical protein
MILHGRCHCGGVEAAFSLGRPVDDVAVRACQCGFCRRHGAATATDPTGHLTLRSAQPLTRYRFGSGATDMLLCPVCGAYVAAVIQADGRLLATVNVNALAMAPLSERTPQPADYTGEDAVSRLARRVRMWTPTTLEEA